MILCLSFAGLDVEAIEFLETGGITDLCYGFKFDSSPRIPNGVVFDSSWLTTSWRTSEVMDETNDRCKPALILQITIGLCHSHISQAKLLSFRSAWVPKPTRSFSVATSDSMIRSVFLKISLHYIEL